MPLRQSESAKLARLEHRVSQDSSSVLFVPLAEAYRVDGHLADAERVLRAGLRHHQEHFSARTALGRVLLELGRPAEALAELEPVHRAVPDNLLAARLAEEARHQAPLVAPDPEPESGELPPQPGDILGSGGGEPAPTQPDPLAKMGLPQPDPALQRRVAALRSFLAAARSLRGHHA